MELKFYNTLSRSLELFKSVEEGKAGLYTCGPTVYNFAHIGNFRAYIFEDLLHRTLEYAGYKVKQVMNLTDVDDKTIRNSRAAGVPLRDFTATYKKAFFEDIKTLNITPAAIYPAATDHIAEMIAMIQVLMDRASLISPRTKASTFPLKSSPNTVNLPTSTGTTSAPESALTPTNTLKTL